MNLERALGEFESEVMPSELPQSLLQILQGQHLNQLHSSQVIQIA